METLSISIHEAPSELRLRALAVSHGVGIGQIAVFNDNESPEAPTRIQSDKIEQEVARFRSALEASILELRELSSATDDLSEPISEIFGVHLLILESLLDGKIANTIRNEAITAESALRKFSAKYANAQRRVDDQHIREKSLDIEDAIGRVISVLSSTPQATSSNTGQVIFANEFRPSQILELNKLRPAALVSIHGGWTSHAAIVARELEIPMICGVRELLDVEHDGVLAIVDGNRGEIILAPKNETILDFSATSDDPDIEDVIGESLSDKIETSDGVLIRIQANADSLDAYDLAKRYGASGIGLFRSESILGPQNIFPSEAEQFSLYVELAKATAQSELRIRTFDIGPTSTDGSDNSKERNPALGLRAIRYGLSNPEFLKSQLSAIIRASSGYHVTIILPMVTGLDEVIRVRAYIEEITSELLSRDIAVGTPKLGVMIETPSSVFLAEEIAKEVDLLCIGTNDLVQYLLAVDRDNENVSDWYQSLHPAVLKAIRNVSSAAENAGISVSICGEMAASPFYVPLLIGMGIREFSMNASSIPRVRRVISGIGMNTCMEIATRSAKANSARETEMILRESYKNGFEHLFPPGIIS